MKKINKMRIYIDDASKDKRIFEGIYQYLEGGRTNGKPSFHISIRGKNAEYEIYFNLDSEEELESLINDLQDLRRNE